MRTLYAVLFLAAAACNQHPPPSAPVASEPVPAAAPAEAPAPDGEKLYTQLGCKACHTIDGTMVPSGGTSFRGLFGSTLPLEGGGSVHVDEAFLRESILKPDAKITAGFPAGVMPRFEGMLNEAQTDALVAFIAKQK